MNLVTIYPCLRGWLVAGLPLICTERAEHQGISLWAGPTSMIPSLQYNQFNLMVLCSTCKSLQISLLVKPLCGLRIGILGTRHAKRCGKIHSANRTSGQGGLIGLSLKSGEVISLGGSLTVDTLQLVLTLLWQRGFERFVEYSGGGGGHIR